MNKKIDKSPGQQLSTNERIILEIVRRNSGIMRSAVMPLTNLTQSSVHRIVEGLEEKGFLFIGESVVHGRGKPSRVLLLNERARYSIGISVNTDSVAVSVCDLAGSVVDYQLLYIQPVDSARTLLKIKKHVLDVLQKHQLPTTKIAGIGFALAGYFVGAERLFCPPEPLSDWALIDLKQEITTLFEMPVWTENNATTGAIGEAFLGAGLEFSSFGYFSFNYGFGGGIILDGKPLKGSFGNAGEISRIYTNEEGSHRPALGELLKRLQSHGISVGDISTLYTEFDPQWPGVKEWVKEIAPQLNRAIDALHAVIDPEAIVFGGELPKKLGELLLDVPPTPREHRWEPAAYPRILLSKLEGDIAATGAAFLPLIYQYFT
ncbi:ROK family transcriptional regulator [Ewingella sp. S1.OA.A_B6]